MNLSIQLISWGQNTSKIITETEGGDHRLEEEEPEANWEERMYIAQRYLGNGQWKIEEDCMKRRYGNGGQTKIKGLYGRQDSNNLKFNITLK